MKAVLFSMALACLCISYCPGQHPGAISLHTAKFRTGDDASWKGVGLDEAGWKDIRTIGAFPEDPGGYLSKQDLGWYDDFYKARVAPHGVQLLIVK